MALLLRFIALASATSFVPLPRAASCEEHYSSPATQSAIAAADNIFFLRMTNETTLSTIERCALASAVLKNPTKRVNLFSNSISCDLLHTAAHADIHLIRFNVSSVYEGTPFAEWFHRRDWDVQFRGVHLTDSFRLVLLYRFGGVYMDTDVISYRSLDGIGVSVGLEDPWVINNAVMSFPRGHAFVYQLMHDFVHRFRNDFWGWNGPRLITRVWMQHFVDAGDDVITLAPVEEYYLISWRDGEDKWKRLFSPASALEVSDLLRRTRVIHFWHSLLSPHFSSIQSGAPFFETVAGQIMYASCPNLHEFADRHEPSASSYGLETAPADSLWLGVEPVVEIMDGRAYPSKSSLDGAWDDNECGFLGASVGVVEIAVPITAMYWTLSFWVNTFVLDATSRQWPHHTPQTRPLCIPHCEYGIPAIPLSDNSLASKIAQKNGDVLVLSVEQGRIAIGNSLEEWSRTASSIADGRWHHVSVAVSPAAAPGTFTLHLVLDGLLHIELIRTQAPYSHIVFGSPTGFGDLFVDKLGLFQRPFLLSEIVRIRNSQLLASVGTRCSPALPWNGAAARPSSGARVVTLIMSDSRQSSVAKRMTTRTSWLTLAAGPHRHVFCVGVGGIDALIDLESTQYGDLVRVPVNDDYQHLSEKVFACLSRTHSLFSGTYDFLVKTDHDVFLRADVLQGELTAVLYNHQRTAANDDDVLRHWQGFVYNDMPPMRDLSDKNADATNPLVTFPPYTAGVCYIISAALVVELISLRDPVYCLNEDQAIGLWMEQRVSFGGRRVSPIHDIRFQQWSTCFPGQLALHFSDSDERQARLAVYNIRAGLDICSDMQLSTCCLCCDCDASRSAWFSCNQKGAFLSSYAPLSSLLLTAPSLDISTTTTPTALVSQIEQTTPLQCPFKPSKWRALGIARIYPGPLGGVVFSCPRDISFDGKEPPSFCAASIVLKPERECATSSTSGDGEILDSVGRFETSSSFGERSSSRQRCKKARSDKAVSRLFFLATVDTFGACTLDHLDPVHRQALVTPTDNEKHYYGPPYYGSFAAFCGILIDVHHVDGSTSTLRTGFARNASSHLHYEIFRIFNGADIEDVAVYIIQPSFPSKTSSIRVSDMKLFQFNRDALPLDSHVLDIARGTALQLSRIDPRKVHISLFGSSSYCFASDSFPTGLLAPAAISIVICLILLVRICRMTRSALKFFVEKRRAKWRSQ